MAAGTIGTNWSGNYSFRAGAVHHPQTIGELQELVRRSRRIRALGSRHSFTAIADSHELISLDRLPGEISVDRSAGTASVPGHLTYAELANALNDHGLALHNLASLPHISVAGAVATATHGSGVAKGNLAAAVRGLQMVTALGEVLQLRHGDDRFDGAVVGLGALGIVTRLDLAVEASYEMRQRVFERLEWTLLFAHFDEIMAAGDSVSVFHRFGDATEQVWVKRRLDDGRWDNDSSDLFGATAATVALHPVLGGDAVNCTEQLGATGPWSERLPHFRPGFTPSSGEEIQSEFFVARHDAAEALQTLRERLADAIAPLLLVSEVRTIAADALWLSPEYGRDTVAIHFTWRRRQDEVEQVVRQIESVLAPFGARPHWGKLFTAEAADLAPLYPRLPDFRRMRDELDPDGTFVNDWLRRRVLGAT
jgi:alditol oxidase